MYFLDSWGRGEAVPRRSYGDIWAVAGKSYASVWIPDGIDRENEYAMECGV